MMPGVPIPMCQQPHAMPVILQGPAVRQGPMGPPQHVPHGFFHSTPLGPPQPHLACSALAHPANPPAPTSPVQGNGDATQSHEGRNAILSTRTAVGNSLQKLVAACRSRPEKTKPSPEVEAGAAGKAAMQGEPTELLHGLLRLATSRSQESGATRATGPKNDTSRKRTVPQEPDEAAILSVIDSALQAGEGSRDTDGENGDGDIRERLVKGIAEAMKAGDLAQPKRKTRRSVS